ncbi:hypothetical protein OIU76_018761 [Salix suchowensis]|nr:hypothetical protein OIU76_018761 [Salix suchowensis]
MSTSSSNSSSSNSAPLTAFTTTHEPESMPVVLPSTTDSGLASVKTETAVDDEYMRAAPLLVFTVDFLISFSSVSFVGPLTSNGNKSSWDSCHAIKGLRSFPIGFKCVSQKSELSVSFGADSNFASAGTLIL